MTQASAVRPDDEFELCGVFIFAAQQLELLAVRVLHRVAVHIEHERDRGVLLQVAFDRRERAVVRARIARIVVERAVVHDANARVGQHLRHFVADADHVAVRVQRAERVGHVVFLPRRHGVALRAVGVDDEHLRPLRTELCCIIAREHRGVERGIRAVVDVHIAEYRIARGVGRLERAGGRAVFRHGDLVRRLLLREHRALAVLRVARLAAAVVGLLLKLCRPCLRDVLLALAQKRRRVQRERRSQAEKVLPAVAALISQQHHAQRLVLERAERIARVLRRRGDAHAPERHRRERERAQHPSCPFLLHRVSPLGTILCAHLRRYDIARPPLFACNFRFRVVW